MAVEIVMPHMGEGVIEGTVGRWLKKEGDSVAQYEPVLEIETDKVTTEATAESAGTLLQILIPEGKTVPVGTVLAIIGQASEPFTAQPTATTAPLTQTSHTNGAPAHLITTPIERNNLGRISPVVSRIAAEHNIDLSQLKGTGLEGRITKKDILAYVEQRTQPTPILPPPQEIVAPTPTPAPSPQPLAISYQPLTTTPLRAELIPHNNMRRAIAEHMVRSKQTSPHVTTVFEADFSAITAHRHTHKEAFAKDGANLTFTPYIVFAIVQALKKHPRVNSSWSDDGLLVKREIHVGVAAAIEGGLIVPIIKNADNYNLLGLARAVNDLTQRARQRQLKPEDIQGGTFSLTNHGTSGSLFATPIINQPQCGILGVGKIEKRVVVIQDAIAIRSMAYISFTFDHRILDGASADGFVSTVKEIIEGWRS